MQQLSLSLALSFILLSGVVLSSLETKTEPFGTPNRMLSDKKTVVVIGAGVSGLTAAKKLNDSGKFNIIVLESQSKVGGRTRTNTSLDGIFFDEGASWIHGDVGNPLMPLAEQAKMTHFLSDLEDVLAYEANGSTIASNTYSSESATFETKRDDVVNHGSSTTDFMTVFNQQNPTKTDDPLWRYFVSVEIAFDLGDPDKLSS